MYVGNGGWSTEIHDSFLGRWATMIAKHYTTVTEKSNCHFRKGGWRRMRQTLRRYRQQYRICATLPRVMGVLGRTVPSE